MAKIALRQYIREISDLIDNGRANEAIDHCLLILKQYPKHLDTYRILGKAYLETHRFSDAEDILKRLLSSRPDDFFAHLGLSIIRENQKTLDEAIWHMERAFEAQPTNTAVGEELRQLYGKRDGIEPLKVRMTRGALVRLYSKGDLLQQGISEARAALLEDPSRIDIQVLLAGLLSKSGRDNEAAELSSLLLSRLPYCFEANRILSNTLPISSQDEVTNPYRQRIIALDPYYRFLKPGYNQVENIPENSVLVDKLDTLPGLSATTHLEPGKTIAKETPRELDASKWLDAIPIVEQGLEKQSKASEESLLMGIVSPEGTEKKDETPIEPEPTSSNVLEWSQHETSPRNGITAIHSEENSSISLEQALDKDQNSVPEIELSEQKEATMDGNDIPLPTIPADDEELPDWLKDSLEEKVPSSEEPGLETDKSLEHQIEDISASPEEKSDIPMIAPGPPELEKPSLPEWLLHQEEEVQAGEEIPLPVQENENPIIEQPHAENVSVTSSQVIEEQPKVMEAEDQSGIPSSETEFAETIPVYQHEESTDFQESETTQATYDSFELTSPEPTGLDPVLAVSEDQPSPVSNLSTTEETHEKELIIDDADKITAPPYESPETEETAGIEMGGDNLQSIWSASEQEQPPTGVEQGTSPTLTHQEEDLPTSGNDQPPFVEETIPPMTDPSMERKDLGPAGQVPEGNQIIDHVDSKRIEVNAYAQSADDQGTIRPILETPNGLKDTPAVPEWEAQADISVPESISHLEESPTPSGVDEPSSEPAASSVQIEPPSETSEVNEETRDDSLPGWLSDLETEKPHEDTVSSWLKVLESEENVDLTVPDRKSQSQVFDPAIEDRAGTGLASEYPETAKLEEQNETQQSLIRDAQKAIEDGELELALQKYQSMVSENQALAEVINELKKALDRFPIDINLWQLLGDAYFRDHQIQNALDAYNKAEELLR